jgi:hypothetical protein
MSVMTTITTLWLIWIRLETRNEENIDDSGMIPHDRDEMYALDALLPVLRDLARLVSSRLK